MDYLDPKKKQAHKTRLLVGYGLFAIAIAMATVLLVYIANGFYIDRSTGEVIQNGLVYIDSRPGGANVFINDQKQRGTTDLRLVIPSGLYKFDLKKDGYRTWSRSIRLEGGSLRRLTYAKLIPNELQTSPYLDFRSEPIFISQSVDKRWLVASHSDNPLILSVIDLDQAVPALTSLQIPSNLVTEPLSGKLEIVEWADDNRHFLASYTTASGVDYILVDRDNPQAAINLNTQFNDKNYEISLQDRKFDKFFVYNPATRTLSTASTNQGVSSNIFASEIIDYRTFGTDWLLYITPSGEEGLVNVKFKRGDKDILLKQIKTADKYLLQLAKLGNAPVMGFSSPIENRAVVYNDPEDYINKNPDVTLPVATTVLKVNSPIDLRISADSSVILAYGLQNFASHEFEVDKSYNFKVDVPVDPTQEIRWLDGQHFLFSSEGKQNMIDFDGSNRYELVPSQPNLGSFYTEDLTIMFSFTSARPEQNGTAPVPARINLTNLLLESDR